MQGARRTGAPYRGREWRDAAMVPRLKVTSSQNRNLSPPVRIAVRSSPFPCLISYGDDYTSYRYTTTFTVRSTGLCDRMWCRIGTSTIRTKTVKKR